VENITLASGAEFVVMKYVRSQPEAEALCAAEYDGGHLAWFMDTAEKDAVFAELGRMRSDLQWGNEMMWIGYTDEATEGTWVAPYPPAGYAADPNSDFGPIRPNAAQFGDFWETGEPNNNDGSGGDENCAALGVGDSVRAVDINCAQRREWGLCKIADAPLTGAYAPPARVSVRVDAAGCVVSSLRVTSVLRHVSPPLWLSLRIQGPRKPPSSGLRFIVKPPHTRKVTGHRSFLVRRPLRCVLGPALVQRWRTSPSPAAPSSW
jgi:hypothetical protein